MITREFDLMLYQEGNLLFINANQYDSGEQWIFTLYEENGVKYTPATGAIVGVKSDGKGIINTGTVDEYGRVVINETQQMTAAAGLATFELLIDNDTHGTANFKVDVEPRPSDNADLSDSDLSLIQQAVDAASEIETLLDGQDVPTVITPIITDWLDDNITNPSNPPIDTSLTVAGAAADAKSTGDEITDLKSQINPWLYLPIDETQFTSGYYVWSDGKAYTNSNYKVSPYIRCSFKRIKFNALTLGNEIQSIAFYSDNSEESFISGYANTESLSTYPVHEMDVPANTKYIRISKNANSAYTVNTTPYVKLTETSESMLERVDNANATAQQALSEIDNLPLLSDVYRSVYSDTNLIKSDGMLEHSYVDDTGTIKTTTNQSASAYQFVLSGYIPVEYGKTLYLSGDDFFYNRYFAWYDADKNYIGGNSLSGGMVFTAHVASVIVPNNASYLRITFRTAENAAVAWAGYTGTAPTGEAIYASYGEYVDYHYYPTNPCDFIGRDVCTFNKILCIGDSITAGYFNHSDGGQTISKYSYPVHLHKITGIDCVNMGDSGETSVSWWNTHQNDDFSGYDCAIINLGINDALLSVEEEDTRTAFTSIINALKTANTGIKIFIANIVPAYARGNTTYDAINEIIEDIATSTENCYFIDLTQYGHTIGAAYVNGHLTAVGYWMLAEDYANAISYIIRNNPEAFRFIQFIGTNLHN